MRNPPMIIPSGGIQNLTPRLMNIGTFDPSDDPIATSYLGTPIYSNIIFEADPDTPENADLRLDTVLFEVNMPRIVVMTPISGRNGTVKEYISNGDYQILISGMIVSQYPNVFPKEEITALRNLVELPKSLAVASSFLQIFSVHNIVVLESRFSEVMGSRNQIAFTLNCVSDQPIEVREL